MITKPHTWIELNKHNLEHNLRTYKNIIGNKTALALVVKSNGYGHGLREIAQLAQESPLVNWLYTTSVAEGVFLRTQGVTKPILASSIIAEDPALLFKHNIQVTVYDLDTIERLNTAGKYHNEKVQIHIKFDTGMSRFGFLPEQALNIIQQAQQLPYVDVVGICSHFSSADVNPEFTQQQLHKFHTLLENLEQNNISIPITHMGNSAAALLYPNNVGNVVRIGAGAYGFWPSERVKKVVQKQHPAATLKPVLTWKTKILYIKTIPAHNTVGYGNSYTTTRETTIALLPVGWYEGYDRRLSNKGLVYFPHAQKTAPVIGKICMNYTIVDITDIPNIAAEQEVILVGDHPGIHAQEIANIIESFNPREIVARLHPDIKRLLLE